MAVAGAPYQTYDPVPAQAGPVLRTASRGRPTAQRAADIATAIEDAALSEFLHGGYDAATMEAIADRAKVSKSTLYARFPGKDVLFRAVLENRLQRWSTVAGASDHLLPPDLPGRLRHHARTLRTTFEWDEYQLINKLVETASNAFPDITVFWRDAGTQRFIRFLADDMAATADARNAKAVDWEFLAQLFLHSYAGWYRTERAGRVLTDSEVAQFVEKLITVVMAMLPGDS